MTEDQILMQEYLLSTAHTQLLVDRNVKKKIMGSFLVQDINTDRPTKFSTSISCIFIVVQLSYFKQIVLMSEISLLYRYLSLYNNTSKLMNWVPILVYKGNSILKSNPI